MIYTITLNPAIDHIIEVEKINSGQTNYYQNEYEVVGGKGINVGVILNNLQDNVILTGLLGLENNDIFLQKFKEINIQNKFIDIPGKTRVNYKIKDKINKVETELNGRGFELPDNIINKILDFLKNNLNEDDTVVACGSIGRLDSNIYKLIGELANEKKATFFLDTAGDSLINALSAKPFLIKPNTEEICGALKIPFNENLSFEELKSLVNQLQKKGATNVLVSMGKDGACLFKDNGDIYRVGIAKGSVVNSVGAGDSMIGGFVHGYVNNLGIEKTLQYAAACGGATAFTEWIGEKKDIEKLVDQILVEKL